MNADEIEVGMKVKYRGRAGTVLTNVYDSNGFDTVVVRRDERRTVQVMVYEITPAPQPRYCALFASSSTAPSAGYWLSYKNRLADIGWLVRDTPDGPIRFEPVEES